MCDFVEQIQPRSTTTGGCKASDGATEDGHGNCVHNKGGNADDGAMMMICIIHKKVMSAPWVPVKKRFRRLAVMNHEAKNSNSFHRSPFK